MSKGLSSAMKDALLTTYLYGTWMESRGTYRSDEWYVPGVEPIITLLSGREIRTVIKAPTIKALIKRRLVVPRNHRWSAWLPQLTKHGLYLIRQNPDYGELKALRALDDL